MSRWLKTLVVLVLIGGMLAACSQEATIPPAGYVATPGASVPCIDYQGYKLTAPSVEECNQAVTGAEFLGVVPQGYVPLYAQQGTPTASASAFSSAATPTAAAATPVATPEASPSATQTAETYDYVPGGPGYTYPEQGSLQTFDDGWTRIRRTTNGQYPTWNFLVKVNCDQPFGNNLQWDSATKLEIFGSINCRIQLKRDFRWQNDFQTEHPGQPLPPDPYDTANAKGSPLGLGWFLTGVGAVTVNDTPPVQLKGPGVKQLAFPKDWKGVWVIDVSVPQNGLLVLNEGERLTDQDNWKLPPGN